MCWRSSGRCKYIHLYADPSTSTLDLNVIKRYIDDKIGWMVVDIRSDFVTYHLKSGDIDLFARKLAEIRVKNPFTQTLNANPLPSEVEFEKRVLKGELKGVGVLYDGFRLQTLFGDLISQEESDLSHIHIIFTNRLIATWDDGDRRYHARVIILGYPAIISISGVVEAPAMPKEFYTLQQLFSGFGGQQRFELLKDRFRGRFIDYDDARLNDVLKGYVMQALFYQIFEEAFCTDRQCRLYNAHWQEDLIKAQFSAQEFCEYHKSLLNQLKPESQNRVTTS